MANDVAYCEHCGAQLTPADKFCGSCGKALASATAEPTQPTAPPPPQPLFHVPQTPTTGIPVGQTPFAPVADPVTQPKSKLPLPAIIGGAVVLVIIAVAIGWYAMKTMFGSPAKPTDPADATAVSKNAGVDPKLAGALEPKPVSGKAFVGYWFDNEKGTIDDARYVFVVKEAGGKLELGLIGDASDAPTLAIRNQSDTVLECEATFPDGKIQPLKLELQPGGTKLIATAGATEEDTEVTTLTKSDVPPKPKTHTPPPAAITAISKAPKNPEDAVQMVRNLPEVAEFIKALGKANKVPHIDCDSEDTNGYHIHVFEIVDDPGSPSHTATMGWYTVDKKTGKVTNDITG